MNASLMVVCTPVFDCSLMCSRFEETLCRCLAYICSFNHLMAQVECQRKVKYSSENAEHEAKLLRVSTRTAFFFTQIILEHAGIFRTSWTKGLRICVLLFSFLEKVCTKQNRVCNIAVCGFKVWKKLYSGNSPVVSVCGFKVWKRLYSANSLVILISGFKVWKRL